MSDDFKNDQAELVRCRLNKCRVGSKQLDQKKQIVYISSP